MMSKTFEASIERMHADLSNDNRLTFNEIEAIIETELEEYGGRENLLDWEIQEIRDKAYTDNGWCDDPFPEAEEAEDEDEDDGEPSWHSMTMSQRLSEVGMSWADFC